MLFYTDYSLEPLNTFNVKAKADIFIEITSAADLEGYQRRKKYFDLPRLILGNGSNILFTKNFQGTVLKNSIKGIEVVSEDNEKAVVKAASGEDFDTFVQFCAKKRLCGIENLSAIPGTVGAAAVQNIGAYGQEASQTIQEVEYYNFETAKIETIAAKDCKFEYRGSIFKTDLAGKVFITAVTFCLSKNFTPCTEYGKLQELLKDTPIITPMIMRRVISTYRASIIPDTKEYGNAGSFFKNPVITEAAAKKILAESPELKTYPADKGKVKLAAGQLIDLCGFKGANEGKVGTAENQALIIVNLGKATGKEIHTFANKIAKAVKEKYGVKLEPEVTIV